MAASSLIVGIDPGTVTGMALYNEATDELLELWDSNFWEAINYCIMSAAHTFCIEVPATKHVHHDAGPNVGAIQMTSVKVGGVLREAELLAQGLDLYCRDTGKRVIRVDTFGKMKHEDFCRLTGWDKGRTNPHRRDAALAIYRRRTGL